VLTLDELNVDATFDVRHGADDPDIELIVVLTREPSLSAAGSSVPWNLAITEADNCVISAFRNWTDLARCGMITCEELGVVVRSRQFCWHLDERAMLKMMIPPVKPNINDESSHSSATNRNPFRFQNYRGITNDESFAMEKSHDQRKMWPPNRQMHQTEEESLDLMHKGEFRIGRHTPVTDCPHTCRCDFETHRSVCETRDLSLTSCLTSSNEERGGESHR
jgi:hypothetical protein